MIVPATSAPSTRWIASWRARINALVQHYDLLPGLQAICKGRFRGFPDYQVKIIAECFNKRPYPSIILGGREIGKTFPLAVGFFLRAITQPHFELFCVPGEKIDQAKVALRYMDILTRKSKVIKPLSGANRRLNLEWTTLSKQWSNGSIIKALAPNKGVLSEHGSVWCDEYQSLPDEVDKALDGFDNRPGDRRWLSGTAQVRGSPLHRAYQAAQRRHPDSVMLFPVKLALDAGILSKDNVEAKKSENGGKLSPSEFDAWFNGIFPDVGTLAWHPIESSIDRKWCVANAKQCSLIGTGCDPGVPVNRFVIAVKLGNGEVHCIDEFELGDMGISSIPSKSLGEVFIELGDAFGGGYNRPFHSMLEMLHVDHHDSNVEGDARDELFATAFKLQAKDLLFVNKTRCPSLWRACEEQTFDEKNEMDRLPLTHYIFAMMHAVRAVQPRHDELSIPKQFRGRFVV